MEPPSEPVLFFKSTTAFQGANDDLVIPTGSEKTDWEVELGVVIGKRAKRVSKEDALNHVGGYVLHNDYSERAWQPEHQGQVKGKSADTYAPAVLYKDKHAIPDRKLRLGSLSGEMKQDGHTSNFLFDVPTVVSYISQFMTLLPGDLISTGTPAGVGLALSLNT